MTIRITDEMLFSLGGRTLENVSRVRRIFDDAGVLGVELHALEVAHVLELRERARIASRRVEQILDFGPLPEHACELNPTGTVMSANDCPVGCSAGGRRIELPDA